MMRGMIRQLCLAPNGIIGDEVIPLYVQDAPLCLHVESLQSGRVGFGQSPRLRSLQQDGLNKGRKYHSNAKGFVGLLRVCYICLSVRTVT